MNVSNRTTHLSAEAYEQEQRENFFQMKVAQGASIRGIYPPDEQTLAEYVAWQDEQSPAN